MTDAAVPAGFQPETDAALHADGAAHWDISAEVLGAITARVEPGMTTLETGAGRSTLAFLAAGAHHTVVTVEPAEIDAIRAAAAKDGVDDSRLVPAIGFSQDVLPRLSPDPLDFALIDGGHGFPIPAVDFTFIAPRLKVGGHLLIDDVDLWTGGMLVDFLKAEPGWAFEGLLRRRTALFAVTEPVRLREWTNQPHVVNASRWPQRWRKARNLFDLILSGDVDAIRGKLANERALANAARDDY